MTYRLLLDEHIEQEVFERLDNRGHDVVRVTGVPELGQGATDEALAAYSKETDRTIVTYDDDFIETVSQAGYRATLYFENDSLPAHDVATIIDRMSEVYPHDEVTGLQKTGKEWL